MNPKYTALFALMAVTAYAASKEKITELTRDQALAKVTTCAAETSHLEAEAKHAVFKKCIAGIKFPEAHKDLVEKLNFSTFGTEFENLWPVEVKEEAKEAATAEKKESTFSWGSTTMIVVYVVAGIAVVGGGAYAVMRGSNKEEL